MKKRYFKTIGEEPDVICEELCEHPDRPVVGARIGGISCQKCKNCYGWDNEENWVKCLKYSQELSKASNTVSTYPITSKIS